MTEAGQTKVLIVDDSAVARRLIGHILATDGGFAVVGQAADGAEAVRLASELRPDVITMDIRMPVMDGYEATRRIMAERPTPIVMVSAHELRAVRASFDALEAGAVTVLPKPNGPSAPEHPRQAAELVSTLRAMAGLRLVTRRSRPTPPPSRAPDATRTPADHDAEPVAIVAIAASTGGPAALGTILRDLPGHMPAPVLLVQHIADGFDAGLANWLQGVSPLTVRLARHGEIARPGLVLVAPNGVHMGVRASGRIDLADSDPIHAHRPAATYLFRSVARAFGSRSLGVILTGIGRDGTEGLLELHAAGGRVVGQDEASSIVYGMPRAAAEAGAVDEVLPVGSIAAAIRRACRI